MKIDRQLLFVLVTSLLLGACSGETSLDSPQASESVRSLAEIRISPRLNAEGYLSFSEPDVAVVRSLIETETYPISEAVLARRLGFPLDSLQHGLSVTAGGGLTRGFVLNTDCDLRIFSHLWDESDALQGAEMLCSIDGIGPSVPEIQPPFPDRESALSSLALTPEEVEQLPRCAGYPDGPEPRLLECFQLNDEHYLLLQATEHGVAIATRRHWG